MIKDTINEMIKQIIENSISWIKEDHGLLHFVDPIDGREISAHYGATHMAASLIIYGEKNSNAELVSKGYALLDSIIKRWPENSKLTEFHNDFNNFALCIIWNYFESKKERKDYADAIKQLVLNTGDSDNPTVNWFPMRWYVNLVRYRWTGKEKFKAECDKCKENIKTATFNDGFIDDRLPVGLSFNLQYDVATVAVMQYLRSVGENIDLSKELGALINAVAPDGDINYLGRGTNQIFAWGLWVYLLASAGKEEQLGVAVNYLKDKVPDMLKNNNLMLNEWPGMEKYMWWDYHYCSVYTAHFLFWLIMAVDKYGKYPINEKIVEPADSGVKIYRGDDYFVTTFSGRKEYLAEKGPCIAALWTKSAGMIIKGTFGPWQGAFGNRHSSVETTIRNFAGLYEVTQNKDFSRNRYIHKILPNLEMRQSETIKPIFTDIKIEVYRDFLNVKWSTHENRAKMLSIPCAENTKMSVLIDDIEVRLLNTSAIRTQYLWESIFQTDFAKGRIWTLQIKR